MTHQTIRNAVAKALQQRPVVLEIAGGGGQFYAVASASDPGKAYLLELDESGVPHCECRAAEHGLYCAHRAALALRLDKVPPQYLPVTPDEAPIVNLVGRGRSSLSTSSGAGAVPSTATHRRPRDGHPERP